jgi:hypothetical protein
LIPALALGIGACGAVQRPDGGADEDRIWTQAFGVGTFLGMPPA